jgi:hypothetical protein
MLVDQFSKTESLVELTHQDQAAVRRDAATLEIDLEGGVKRKLEGLSLSFTRWVLTSGASSSLSDPHEY